MFTCAKSCEIKSPAATANVRKLAQGRSQFIHSFGEGSSLFLLLHILEKSWESGVYWTLRSHVQSSYRNVQSFCCLCLAQHKECFRPWHWSWVEMQFETGVNVATKQNLIDNKKCSKQRYQTCSMHMYVKKVAVHGNLKCKPLFSSESTSYFAKGFNLQTLNTSVVNVTNLTYKKRKSFP